MHDYQLYYWELPFRGNFLELLLVNSGVRYQCHDAVELYPNRCLQLDNPAMAPPFLYDCQLGKYFAQMPACLMHLGHKHDYLPKRTEALTLALKLLLDCNDVLLEITNHHGLKMWTKSDWETFRYGRLADWMTLFERTGQLHGLKSGKGYMLGSRISVADIAITALFGSLTHAFPALLPDLEDNAPHIANLFKRIESRPVIRHFLEAQRKHYGNGYCGGQIEANLRKMIR